MLFLLGLSPVDPDPDWLLATDDNEDKVADEFNSAMDEVMDMDEGEAMIDRRLAATATADEIGLPAPLPPLVPGALSVKSESSVNERPTDQSTSKTADR